MSVIIHYYATLSWQVNLEIRLCKKGYRRKEITCLQYFLQCYFSEVFTWISLLGRSMNPKPRLYCSFAIETWFWWANSYSVWIVQVSWKKTRQVKVFLSPQWNKSFFCCHSTGTALVWCAACTCVSSGNLSPIAAVSLLVVSSSPLNSL